jgi:hypothetical protein
LARLSFAYLFFGEAKKSKARGRRKPFGSPFLCLLSFGQAKESNSAFKAETGIQNLDQQAEICLKNLALQTLHLWIAASLRSSR